MKIFLNLTNRQKGTIIVLLIVPFIICDVINYFTIPESIQDATPKVIVEIPKGATLHAIAETLKTKQLIEDIDLFKIWMISMGKETDIKAGYFEVPRGLNYAQLSTYLSEAKAMQIKVTLLEGWSISDIAKQFETSLGINKEKFINLTQDSTFLHELGINQKSLQGYLLPDTYFFYWGMEEELIIKKLVENCLSIFDTPATEQIDSLKMNIHDILTLASIIEGEAIFDDERRVISSVYYNRLNRKIKLQADPTIQYILKGPPRRLLYKDLEIDSPYNTYKYYGLPPGPINNPGTQSILAAIYPEKTNYLYFVAKGDGRHTFSRTAAEHAREKAKFNKIRRQVKRNKKLQNMGTH